MENRTLAYDKAVVRVKHNNRVYYCHGISDGPLSAHFLCGHCNAGTVLRIVDENVIGTGCAECGAELLNFQYHFVRQQPTKAN